MTREEWDALADADRPAVRMCIRTQDAVLRIPTSVTGTCAWCGYEILTDQAQELPHELRDRGYITVCMQCVHSHPELGPLVRKNMISAYQHWLQTGVARILRTEDRG